MKSKINPIIAVFGCLLATPALNAQPVNGEIVKIKSVPAAKFATPADGSTDENVIIGLNANSTGNQYKWKVSTVRLPGGTTTYYKFLNINSNKYLGVLNASRDQYGFACQKSIPIGATRAQERDMLWMLEGTSSGFRVKNLNSNLYLAIEGGGAADNSKLIQWGNEGQADLNWQFQPAESDTASTGGRKVLFDIILNFIAVSEATRNRIDNGDCQRVFGHVRTELWELDEHNEMKTKLSSFNNMREALYNQPNYSNPPTAALDYYRSNLGNPQNLNYHNNEMGKVTYNIPDVLLSRRRVMLVVKINLGSRHKDNDLASYDAIRMQEEISRSYILDYFGNLSEIIQTTATGNRGAGSRVTMGDIQIPSSVFGGDDTHKIWVKISGRKNL